jgi:hypothetical protein
MVCTNTCCKPIVATLICLLIHITSALSSDLYYYRPAKTESSEQLIYDVVVYGGTPAGVTAAIEASRGGHKTLLISFNSHVGGLTSGGLTATDIGKQSSIGGLALAFYNRLGTIADFSSQDAEDLFISMLKDAEVKCLFNKPLRSAALDGNRIVSIVLDTGEQVSGRIFMDATYEGDLLAAAKVSYHVGREPSSAYDESLAGQWQDVSWKGVYQFCDLPISPFQEEGNPESGLLPEISSDPPGKKGDGDYKVQAYNFRMILSNKPDRIPFPEPRGYDPSRYDLLARFMNFSPALKWTLNYTTRPMTDGPVQMRNGDSNNAGSFSSDYVGGNYTWPDGTYNPGSFSNLPAPRRGLPVPLLELYKIREVIFQDHVRYQQGLLYFLSHDERVPEELQKRCKAFGLDPNEFQHSGHWPHQLYIREARRMVSDYVMTQANCESMVSVEDSIGLASYPMDSHFCQRVVVDIDGRKTVRNEGGFGHPCKQPYPIAYRSIRPRKEECQNLLVPVCLSASHVAYGSIRMEPVFMILGQSAGAAANIAIKNQQAVQDIDYHVLKDMLIKHGQILTNDPGT